MVNCVLANAMLFRWIASALSVARRLIAWLHPDIRQNLVDRFDNCSGILKLDKVTGIRDQLIASTRG